MDYGSDSDDDCSPAAAAAAAAAANTANLAYYSGAGILLWDSPSQTVILGCDFNREWSDFGGKRDATDRDAWHTASREAVEESLGVLDGRIVNQSRVMGEVRAGTYVCYLVDTSGTRICREFNGKAAAAKDKGKRIEVSQMLRFPIAALVQASLTHQKQCPDAFNNVHTIRGRVLRAVRLFHERGLLR